MPDYTNVDYSITPMGKTVKMVNSDGSIFEAELSVVHTKSKAILDAMPAKIANTIVPGSLAYLTGMSKTWQKDFSGTWEEVEL